MSTRNALVFAGLIASTLSAGVVAPTPLELILYRELLAPCCYRETLDHHMSDAATAMKAEIREMVASGRTEREIVELYKSRYGLKILAEPEGAAWWIGTLTPFAALAIGVVIAIRILGKWSPHALGN